MNRRAFLSSLIATAVAAKADVLDLDRLLWVPGKKKISIPAPRQLYVSRVVAIDYDLKIVTMDYTPWYPINAGDMLIVDFSKVELLTIYPEATK